MNMKIAHTLSAGYPNISRKWLVPFCKAFVGIRHMVPKNPMIVYRHFEGISVCHTNIMTCSAHLQSSSPFSARCSVRKGQPSGADFCVQRTTAIQLKAALNVRPHRSGQGLPGLAMDRKWRFPETTEPKTTELEPLSRKV